MEIGKRIRGHRADAGMSQDDLAQRVYVSRQTISSWENDKTYPDVQSLIILSDVFGTTVDELVKGDVEVMERTIDEDAKLMNRLGYAMTGLLALALAAFAWFAFQMVVWDWPLVHAVPTIVLFFVLWGAAMAAGTWIDRIKKAHDLVTYREISAFMKGEPVDRDTEKGNRIRSMDGRVKTLRVIGGAIVFAAVGAFFGWHGAALLDSIFVS
ncbi:helix-turn-helix domain-containing protein [Enteroscipio rubneri]|uniref:XRE family transcriptional regulator n=1 Tax=Enteroscipio rubneri TaxID=2070686 RepID=A0A2K2U8Y8_9ACTN|nr:helix-turn-helix transcriptional regulator [Enteroscipio rubneri]PNV66791.1 XRE family transcriptional regulator [Enteroscipio rubneri]